MIYRLKKNDKSIDFQRSELQYTHSLAKKGLMLAFSYVINDGRN